MKTWWLYKNLSELEDYFYFNLFWKLILSSFTLRSIESYKTYIFKILSIFISCYLLDCWEEETGLIYKREHSWTWMFGNLFWKKSMVLLWMQILMERGTILLSETVMESHLWTKNQKVRHYLSIPHPWRAANKAQPLQNSLPQ